jgi:dATP pyrophosphohydrolase
MPRAAFQVVVFPFRRNGAVLEYAIFRRADDGSWQGVAGGGEEGETPAAAARREAAEEAGIPATARLYSLQTTSTVPVTCIDEKQRRHWPRELFVMPNHAFAVDGQGCELRLSAEHSELAWLTFARAIELLRWESNRIALGELNERLSRDTLPEAG